MRGAVSWSEKARAGEVKKAPATAFILLSVSHILTPGPHTRCHSSHFLRQKFVGREPKLCRRCSHYIAANSLFLPHAAKATLFQLKRLFLRRCARGARTKANQLIIDESERCRMREQKERLAFGDTFCQRVGKCRAAFQRLIH